MRTNRSPALSILLVTVLGCGGERSDSAVKSDGDERAGGVAVFCGFKTPDALKTLARTDEAAVDQVPPL